jgi:hypothetical protein
MLLHSGKMPIKLTTCLFAIILMISSCTPGQSTHATLIPSATLPAVSTSSPLPTLTPTQTPVPPTDTPAPEPGFVINGQPFKFLGAFVPGRYWGEWSIANDIAILTEAKKAGFTVLHLMPPQYEKTLGNYNEAELKKLDHFMNVANQNGIYITIPFLQGLATATQAGTQYADAFANPGGIEGLIHQSTLRTAFKAHMAALISRVNTVNGRKYSEDPTLMSWMIAEEIVSAPFNYPQGFPNVTAAEVAAWVQENAAYIKTLDANHLVSLNTTTGVDSFDQLGQDWMPIVEAPALDFVEVEDAEARIRDHPDQMYTIDKMYELNKPVVMMLSFTGGGVDKNKYCSDYRWQADTYRQIVDLYLNKGATGFTIFSWRSSQNTNWECYSYNIDTPEVIQALQDISSELGSLNVAPQPLDFVRLVQ